jgi:hypothetical protein
MLSARAAGDERNLARQFPGHWISPLPEFRWALDMHRDEVYKWKLLKLIVS